MDINGMAERIVQAAAAQWEWEIPYDFSVAMGEIPAYQTYFGTTMFIERGRAFLRNKKRDIVLKHGQAEYDEIVRAFDELADAWEKMGVAEESASKAKQHLDLLRDKFGNVQKMMLEWD